MASTTVRISPTAHSILRRVARECGESMQSSLTKAIELYRRRIFLEKANQAFAAMRKDPKSWEEELKEREAWDITLSDDVKDS